MRTGTQNWSRNVRLHFAFESYFMQEPVKLLEQTVKDKLWWLDGLMSACKGADSVADTNIRLNTVKIEISQIFLTGSLRPVCVPKKEMRIRSQYSVSKQSDVPQVHGTYRAKTVITCILRVSELSTTAETIFCGKRLFDISSKFMLSFSRVRITNNTKHSLSVQTRNNISPIPSLSHKLCDVP